MSLHHVDLRFTASRDLVARIIADHSAILSPT